MQTPHFDPQEIKKVYPQVPSRNPLPIFYCFFKSILNCHWLVLRVHGTEEHHDDSYLGTFPVDLCGETSSVSLCGFTTTVESEKDTS